MVLQFVEPIGLTLETAVLCPTVPYLYDSAVLISAVMALITRLVSDRVGCWLVYRTLCLVFR